MCRSLVAILALALCIPAVAQPPRGFAPDPSRVHDPSTIVREGDDYWLFATGFGVASRRSKDLIQWEPGPAVFAEPPAWVTDVVPNHRGYFWAPDVIRAGNRWLLYYSVSAFGKQTSAIALASNPTLDPADPNYHWTDAGIVVRTDETSDHNAIDPGLVRGDDGTLWMTYGSFWSGIKLVQLDPNTGLRIAPDSPIHSLANKEQIEAATIRKHGDHFYLFVNWGWCCRGLKSTYEIRVGRSRSVTGPYLDRDGKDLVAGGGSPLLATEGRFIGPGHPGLLDNGDRTLLSYHFYDAEANGRPRLAIRPIEWADDGWPRIAGDPITPAT
jgi:arabinan endo-1,5-alpha-L-arabinosidase